jgi:hypothetical protein
MKICWDNKFDGATLNALSENPFYPVVNLQDSRISRKFRSVDDNDQTILISGISTAVSFFCIVGHNFTSGVTLRLQGNNSNSWGSPSFDQEIPYNAGMIFLRFTPATYTYWRIWIDDDSNTDTYIEISRFVMGSELTMPGMKIDQEINYNTTGSAAYSYTGQGYGTDGYEFREVSANFAYMTNTQRKSIQTMYDTVKNIIPVLMMIWADDTTFEAPIYCTIDTKKLVFKRTDSDNYPWSLQLDFREVY